MTKRTSEKLPIPQRIAMLSVHTSPLAKLGGEKTGGMNVYVRDLSRALGRMGVAVDVFTRTQESSQAAVDTSLGGNIRVISIPAGPIEAIPTDEVRYHLDAFVENVLHFAATEGILYSLIHSHYWLSGLAAEQLRSAWNAPIVQMFHTLGHMKNQVAQNRREQASPARLEGECRVVAAADRLVAATPAERSQLVEYYDADPGKIIVIPPGVDLERFYVRAKTKARTQLGLSPERANILFAGRIEPLKGIDTLIHAAALLRAKRPEALAQTGITIIGGDTRPTRRNHEMNRLYDLRCTLDLCDIVGFLGAKEQDVLPDYLAAADVVVMPSHYESFGMVALEAMATGTPVIASDVGGLAHLVQNGRTGFHVPPGDPAALAQRIDEILSEADLRQRLGDQASAYARQFDWSIIAKRIMHHVYLPLLRR
jgi:D-inositol-3-phosphate glycosyltransferase